LFDDYEEIKRRRRKSEKVLFYEADQAKKRYCIKYLQDCTTFRELRNLNIFYSSNNASVQEVFWTLGTIFLKYEHLYGLDGKPLCGQSSADSNIKSKHDEPAPSACGSPN